MSRRAPLLRMIILVTFIIVVLIVVLTQKSNMDNIAKNPNYKEIFFWHNKNQAYSLLLHSTSLYDSSFSAYSLARDSLIIFSINPAELHSIKNKLKGDSFNKQQCTSCHID